MAYYRTVDNLQFEVFEVFGVYIPSIEMIQDILNERFTDGAKRQFCDISNHYCSIFKGQISNELPPDTPENKLTIDRIKLDKQFMGTKLSMSAIVGYSFQKLIISIDLSIKYLNFKRAVDYISGFYDSISSLYGKGNLEIINLSNKQDDIIKKIASLEEKVRRQYPKEFIFFCKYCQSYHTFNSFKARETCGSKDCERKADNYRKLIDRKRWVEDLTVRPKNCGLCGSRRTKINTDRLCLHCYLELVNCIENYLV